MDDQHKEALARGRREGHIVRSYLRALEEGDEQAERADSESLAFEFGRIETRLAGGVDPLERVELIQRKTEIERELTTARPSTSLEDLEHRFVSVIRSYATRKGLSYWALREVGVPDGVLARAGIQPDRDHPAVRRAAQRGEAEPRVLSEGSASSHEVRLRSPERKAAESLTGMLGHLLGNEKPAR